MTNIERVKTTLNGNVPDRIPVMAHIFMLAIREAGVTHREFRENPEVMARVMAAVTEKYDLDGVFFDLDTTLLASACGADVIYPENAPAVVKGAQTRSLRQLVDDVSGVDLLASPRVRGYLEAVERLCAWGREHDRYIRATAGQGPFSLACLLTGMDEFMVSLADEDSEEDVRRLIDATLAVSIRMHELVFRAGAPSMSYGNSSEGCSVISPRMFRAFCKEPETRLAAELRRRGIPTMCHICGDVGPILPDLVETGCPAYELDWLTDVKRIFELAHGKFVLSGNVNPTLFSTGTPDEVYAATKDVCDLYRGKGGLVLCSGCAIGPDTPEANMRAFVRAGREGS